MLDFGFYNMDCMEGMREFPDQFFDLAIVDPPYGINVGQSSMGAGGGVAPHRNRSAANLRGGSDEHRRSETIRIKVGGAVKRDSIQVGGVCVSPQNLQGIR
jgi:site-specific DNA-methyltransferase (adenine-specific)